jgi:hypothetical protein
MGSRPCKRIRDRAGAFRSEQDLDETDPPAAIIASATASFFSAMSIVAGPRDV